MAELEEEDLELKIFGGKTLDYVAFDWLLVSCPMIKLWKLASGPVGISSPGLDRQTGEWGHLMFNLRIKGKFVSNNK